MRARTWGLAAAAAVAIVAVLPQVIDAQQARSGYLPSGTIDITQVLSPAPQKGDARYEADRAVFKATRHWQGTPRWDLATRDVDTSPAAMAADFSCALDVVLTPENAPLTVTLIRKAGVDAGTQSGAAKDYFKRLRPYQIDEGATCQPAEQLKGSYDYPSGHTTWGWTWATLLTELAPDRATPIMARGRAYGESRLVCGVHNASAVEAGRITASATLAAVHAQPAFIDDIAKARAELTALRSNPARQRPKGCAAEATLVALPIL